MATTRIKDISSTVTSLASDDYVAVDGATNGTRKMVRGSIYTDVAAAFTGAPTTYDICPLNSGTGKIDATYLPTSGDTPKGEWNASTNSPSLIDGTGTAGDYYDVTTAGSQDLGSGSITFTVGDVVKYNGSTWYKIDSVANFLDGYSTAATSRAALEVNSVDEDAEATATKLIGPAMYFDGSSSVVTVADDAKLSFTDGTDDLPFSISAFVKMTDATNSVILSKFGAGAGSREWVLYSQGSDQLSLLLIDSSGNQEGVNSDAALTDYEGKWIHVAASYSGAGPSSASGISFVNASSAIALYINGNEVPTSENSSGTYTGMSDTAKAVSIGERNSSDYFDGEIRNVQIFNRELTATEVSQLARGNDLGFADEWGGALGGNGTIDETVGLASWTGSGSLTNNNLTETANTTVGARANVLKLEATATGALDTRFYGSGWAAGKRVRIEFDYYLPSTNSTIDTVSVVETGGSAVSITETTQDAWTRVSTEVLTNGTGTFQFRLRDGGVNNATIGDYIGLDNFRITEIGTLADFRAENYDADLNKLVDISDNAFVGTGTSVSLTGRAYPVYETGTWTPSVTFGGGSTGITYGAQEGYYTRIGNQVTIHGSVTLTSKGTDTGQFKIAGLPYTSANTSGSLFSACIGYGFNWDASITATPSLVVATNDTTLFGTVALSGTLLTDTAFSNTTVLRFSATYQIQ